MGNDSSSRYSRLIAHIGSSNGCIVEKFYLGKNGMKWAKNEHDMSYIRSYIVVRVGPQRVTTRSDENPGMVLRTQTIYLRTS